MRPVSFLRPLLRDPGARWGLRSMPNGHLVAHHVLPAFDPARRRTGLLGRDQLHEGHAMIIAPSNAVHTCFMRFPIDLAFVTREGLVLKTRANVGPWRLSVCLRAFAVVELPAGTLDRHQIKPGDSLSATPGMTEQSVL